MSSNIRVGSMTPWGSADGAEEIAPGIVQVFTPSHGGIHLDAQRNAKVHPVWRVRSGWYEEDCEAGIVVATFPEAFTSSLSERAMDRIHDSLAWAFTAQHAVAFPAEAAARIGRPTFDSHMAELRARQAGAQV